MNVEQFRQVESLFEAASALPADQREAFLQHECDDESVRTRVRGMLGHDSRELVVPEIDGMTRQLSPGNGAGAADELTGTRIGSYRLLELIGEGGFGSVYMAEQREPVHRLVAVKVIKLGMDTRQVIARFDAERQALAMMDHTGIARVLDAGATGTGRPYFVMELVRGVPITQYCDRNRLTIQDRLRLFTMVCGAVHHAHQKGVIHRDLKPSNVLVTMHDGNPLPKIIDFGIAKATRGRLTDKTLVTEFRQFIGTPDYMSPEQAEMSGIDIDTRTDIYSLGVLLHKLLAGVLPFAATNSGDRDDLLRQILEQEPRKPSTRVGSLGDAAAEIAHRRKLEVASLQRALKGDLDWIILKAIARDRSRRYESAAELAHEIERSLDDRPISARPPGVMYLGRKFIRRHRMMVGATALVALALVTGLVFTVLALNEANHQRDLAVAAKGEAEQRLWESYLAQARAARSTDRIGRRYDGLSALARAAQIRPTDELRDEAIACLVQSDFRHETTIPDVPMASTRGLDRVNRYAYRHEAGRVRVMSLADGEQLAEIVGPPYEPWVIQFSRDGRYVAVKFHDEPNVRLIVWDIAEQREAVDIEASGRVADSMAFDDRGMSPSWFAVNTSPTTIEIFRLPEGEPDGTIDVSAPIMAIAADPSSARIAVSHYVEQLITIWNVESRHLVSQFETGAGVRGLDWDSKGARIAAALSDGSVGVWEVNTGERELVARGHEGEATRVLFGGDDTLIASHGWDNTTRLWRAKTGEEVFAPLLNRRLLGFGDRLALDRANSLSILRFNPGREFQVRRSEVETRLQWLELGQRNTLLLFSGRDASELWDVQEGRPLAVLAGPGHAPARMAETGDTLIGATADGLTRWRIRFQPGGEITFDRELLLEQEGIRAVAIDGQRAAIATSEFIDVVDLNANEQVARFPTDRGVVNASTLQLKDNWLFAESWRGTPPPRARVLDVRVGRARGGAVLELPGTHVNGRFSPDGNWFIASTGEEFGLYDVNTWRRVRTMARDNTDELAGPAAIASRAGLVAVAHSRFEIRLLDLATGAKLAALRAPESEVITDIQLTDDGGLLVASTSSNAIQIWDLNLIRTGLRGLALDWPDPR